MSERVGLFALRPLGRILLVAFAAGYLAACTQVVDSAVEGRYAQYNYSTDWAKNEAILLNIARASEYQPLNFMSFQPYQGTATVSGSAAAPSFVIGPDRINSQKQYSISNSTLTATASGTGTVTVTSLDTYDFYDSLLSPVDYVNLNAFQRQGYPRELLFRLFADYVSVKPGTGDPQGKYSAIVYNDPSEEKSCFPLPLNTIKQLYGSAPSDDKTRICFKDLVVFALVSGLSSEVRTVTPPSGGGQSPAAAPAAKTTGTNGNSSPPKPQTEGRLCFDTALATRAILEFKNNGLAYLIPNPIYLLATQYHPLCGGTGPLDVWQPTSKKSAAASDRPSLAAAEDSKQLIRLASTDPTPPAAAPALVKNPKKTSTPSTAPSTTTKPGISFLRVHVPGKSGFPVWDIHILGEHVIEIGTRSAFSMYNFLGSLLRVPQSQANQLTGPPDDSGDPYILTVHKGQPTGCFTAAILDLSVYCVPIGGAANTKRTFSILAQLLALKTTTDDLQLLPTIRLLPTQ